MLKEIFETCAKKPFLSKTEQESFFAKIEEMEKRNGSKIWEKNIAISLGVLPETFSHYKKQKKILRLLDYLVDNVDKAQKYDEIKKI